MRYGIFAVSPVLDSSEAERRQANRAYPPREFITFPKISERYLSIPSRIALEFKCESLNKVKKEIKKGRDSDSPARPLLSGQY